MQPDWIERAANEIYERVPEIINDARQAGQLAQDPAEDRRAFVKAVAAIIAEYALPVEGPPPPKGRRPPARGPL